MKDLQKKLEERDEKIAELEVKLAELIEENERLRGLLGDKAQRKHLGGTGKGVYDRDPANDDVKDPARQGLTITPAQLRAEYVKGDDMPDFLAGTLSAKALRQTVETFNLLAY